MPEVPASEPTLLERHDVLARLDLVMRAVAGGRVRIVGLRGPSGLGKTAILDALAQRAAARHLLVGVGACRVALEAEGIRQVTESLLADSWVRQLPEAVPFVRRVADDPPDRSDDRDGERHRIELVTLLVAIAAQRPLLVLLDDAHWLGASGWSTLQALVRTATYRAERGEALRLGLVVAFRDAEVDQDWAALTAAVGASDPTVVELAPLSELAVNELLRRDVPGPVAGELVAAVLRRTGGNPLHVVQTTRLLRERLRNRSTGAWSGAALVDLDVDGASDLRSLVAGTVTQAGRPARAATAAVALGSDRLDRAMLDAVVGALDAAGGVEDAVRRELLVERNGRISVRHAVFGDAAIDAVEADDLDSIHAVLAQQFLQRECVVEAAWHARHAGGRMPVDQTAELMDHAAHLCLRSGDYSLAAELGAAALSVGAALGPPRIAALHHAVALARFRCHDPLSAEHAITDGLRQARRSGDIEGEARLLSILARSRLTFDPHYVDPPELVEFLGRSPQLSPSRHARLVEDLAEFAILRHDDVVARGRVEQSIELAEASGDPLALAPAYFARGLADWVTLDLHRAARPLHASRRAAQQGDDPWLEVWGVGRLGLVHLMRAELTAATRTAEEAAGLAERVTIGPSTRWPARY